MVLLVVISAAAMMGCSTLFNVDGRSLEGTVCKIGTKEGIPDVIIEVTSKGRLIDVTKTDSYGHFRIGRLNGERNYTLSFSNSTETVIERSKDYDLSRMSKKQAKKLTIKLALRTVITGRIIDEADNPVANVTIEVVEDKGGRFINAVVKEERFKTGANGKFTIQFPIRGKDTSARKYRLRITSDRIKSATNYYPQYSKDPNLTKAPHSLSRGDVWSIGDIVVTVTDSKKHTPGKKIKPDVGGGNERGVSALYREWPHRRT